MAHIVFLLNGAILDLRSADFPWEKGPHGKYFRFVGYSVSITTTHLCFAIKRPATDNSRANKYDCPPVQLCLFTKAGSWLDCPMDHRLPTTVSGHQTFIPDKVLKNTK